MDERLKPFEEKMQKTYDFLEGDLATIRAGRANPHVLDKIKVDYYGTPTPIQQVGNVTVPEARVLQIAPWEKSLIKDIEKAIMMSDVGITPSNDGSLIRLVFPELTEERRKELVKDIKKRGEENKVAIRNTRRDGNDALKKLAKTEVSEDEIKELEEKLARKRQELDAVSLAMDAMAQANARLQERFSPELNRLTGQYMARLTQEKYPAVTLTRELEGFVRTADGVLPRAALYLSRGTADQLYLAVRLAVCRLCLPEKPPIFLDDALSTFDDSRLALALELLGELAGEQQILLFTCQRREADYLRWAYPDRFHYIQL